MERLQKVLAHAGVASRRKSEDLIRRGRVTVNGKIEERQGVKVDPEYDRIAVDGREIRREKPVHLLFYKPPRVITSVRDPEGRRVVTDFIDIHQRIYPAGRLDYDTEGLLVLTNDGKLAHGLTHPRHEFPKVYEAWVKGIPDKDRIEQLAAGVRLDDGWTAPAKVKMLQSRRKKQESRLQIVIHEGRNRQVKRMCEAVDHPVRRLIRTQLGFLTLDTLNRGEYRHLTPAEVQRCYRMAGIDPRGDVT